MTITSGLLLTGSDSYNNTAGLLLTGIDVPLGFYCFIIYFNLYVFVESISLYIRYVEDKSINIKHYKCYGYMFLFTPKFGRRARKLIGFQDCANQGID